MKTAIRAAFIAGTCAMLACSRAQEGSTGATPPPDAAEPRFDGRVTFVVRNAGDKTAYAVLAGHWCLPFALDRETTGGWQLVPLAMLQAESCYCECVGVGPYIKRLRALTPGESVSFPWDGVVLRPYEKEVECGPIVPTADGGAVKRVFGAPTRAAQGKYRVRVGGLAQPTPQCKPAADATTEFDCGAFGDNHPSEPFQEACVGNLNPTEFVLGAGGDLTVNVGLP